MRGPSLRDGIVAMRRGSLAAYRLKISRSFDASAPISGCIPEAACARLHVPEHQAERQATQTHLNCYTNNRNSSIVHSLFCLAKVKTFAVKLTTWCWFGAKNIEWDVPQVGQLVRRLLHVAWLALPSK